MTDLNPKIPLEFRVPHCTICCDGGCCGDVCSEVCEYCPPDPKAVEAVDDLAAELKAVETFPCEDCQKPVWYCGSDFQHYHTDPNHSCFLSNGKAPQVP